MSALLPILIQIFAAWFQQQKCFNPTPAATAPQDPQEFLNDHYDAETGTFDRFIVRQAMPKTRNASQQKGIVLHGRKEVRAHTVAALEATRTADSAKVAKVMADPNDEQAAADLVASSNMTSVKAAFDTEMADDSVD